MLDFLDFNDAEPQKEFALIPNGTIAKARLNIKKDGSSYVTTSKYSDSKYLDCKFEILEGQYKGRNIYSKIGIEGNELFVKMGRSSLKALLESKYGLRSNDITEYANTKRRIEGYYELEDSEVIIKIKLQKAKNENERDRNEIDKFITADMSEYPNNGIKNDSIEF